MNFFYRPNGIDFAVPMPDVELKIGDVVTFAYDNYSHRSAPVNPTIIRSREDITWKDILFDFRHNLVTQPQKSNGLSYGR
jgi:hypothetical protein